MTDKEAVDRQINAPQHEDSDSGDEHSELEEIARKTRAEEAAQTRKGRYSIDQPKQNMIAIPDEEL